MVYCKGGVKNEDYLIHLKNGTVVNISYENNSDESGICCELKTINEFNNFMFFLR